MSYGLLGRTLGHSFSPQIHAQIADYDYDLFEVEPADITSFLKVATGAASMSRFLTKKPCSLIAMRSASRRSASAA